MGEVSRSFSVTVVRAQAICLLERLSQLGPGARTAAQRRQVSLRLEEKRRRERQAFALCPRVARSGPHWEGLCALNCSSH